MEKFVNLRKWRISVKEYTLKFHQLSRYALAFMANMRVGMIKFASGLNWNLILESKTALRIEDVDISRLTVHM